MKTQKIYTADEEGTQFVTSNLTNRIKELKKDKDDDELLKKLNEANKLLKEQKAIQKEIKTSKENIHAMTKDKLESLSIEEAKALVYEKRISPLMDQLNQIPQNVMEKLKKQLEQLEDKYSETLNDLDDQIHQTEQELAKMIDDLTGNEYDMKGLEAFKSLLGY